MCQNELRIDYPRAISQVQTEQITHLTRRLYGLKGEEANIGKLVACLEEDPEFQIMPGEKFVAQSAVRLIRDLRGELATNDAMADRMLEHIPDKLAEDYAARGLSIGEAVIEYLDNLKETNRVLTSELSKAAVMIGKLKNTEPSGPVAYPGCDLPCRHGMGIPPGVGVPTFDQPTTCGGGKLKPENWWIS